MSGIFKTVLLRTKLAAYKRGNAYPYYNNYKKMRELITNQSPEHGIRYLWNKYMDYPLNLMPRSFNEKLQWLKLNC